MSLIALTDIDPALREFNRVRYKNELAQGIYDLMRKQGVMRSELAAAMGFSKGRISHILSGEKNLQADSLADVLLVLGRTPHLVLGTNFDVIGFAVDEASNDASESTRTLEAQTSFVQESQRVEDTTETATTIQEATRPYRPPSGIGRFVGPGTARSSDTATSRYARAS